MLSRQCTPIARSIVKKKNDTWQPQWVALPILDFVREIHKFEGNDEALCKWVKKFSEDLLFCNTDTEDELTKNLLMDSFENFDKQSKAGRKAGLASAKARKQRQQNSAAPSPTREDGVNMHDTDNRGSLESGNDAANNKCMVAGNGNTPEDSKLATAMHTNFDGEPEYREDSDDGKSGSSPSSTIEGAEVGNDSGESATTLEGLALDMPGPDKASDPRGDNTANVQPSDGPEDGDNLNWHEIVQQSLGTAEGYDQETEARESQTGAGTPPVRDPDCHNAPAPRFPRKSRPPKNAEEVRCFAADHAIDVDDARDWYEMNYVDRPGCDKDGVEIENWKGHCTAYCQTMAERRKAG